jgi:hypothetical protein
MENTPFVYKGETYIALNHRNDSCPAMAAECPGRKGDYNSPENMYLYIAKLHTGQEVARFGFGFSFVNAFVDGDTLHIFASEGTKDDWFHDIYHFSTTDMKTWQQNLAIPRENPKDHLFNTSVTRDDHGYLMVYETTQPVTWCFKFARSKDLCRWEKVPGLAFTETHFNYSACPVVRYIKPWYYAIYLHMVTDWSGQFVPYLARSQNLVEWELSPFNPVIQPGPGEGRNNSDVDLFEYEGRTWLYYATGDQGTWGTIKIAMYDGPMKEFFERSFPAGITPIRCRTDKPKP